jgi:hypothetical protein
MTVPSRPCAFVWLKLHRASQYVAGFPRVDKEKTAEELQPADAVWKMRTVCSAYDRKPMLVSQPYAAMPFAASREINSGPWLG